MIFSNYDGLKENNSLKIRVETDKMYMSNIWKKETIKGLSGRKIRVVHGNATTERATLMSVHSSSPVSLKGDNPCIKVQQFSPWSLILTSMSSYIL